MSEFSHKPIMLMQCIEGLDIKPNGIYVDGTCGGAGHSKEIAKRIQGGMLYGLDQDPDAVAVATERLAGLPAKVLHTNFRNAKYALAKEGVEKIDGVLLDLGVSSYQLDNAERGFSYKYDAKLDMRMNQQQELSAYTIVNEYPYEEIVKILFRYGEDPFSKQVARKIEQYRANKPIETTFELVDIIKSAYPAKVLNKKGHPAKKIFQAIRIAVNDELHELEVCLEEACE